MIMSENKIVYITPEAERKAKWIAYQIQRRHDLKEVDTLINSAIESFLKEEPIDNILENINHVNQNRKADDTKFNDWVYDKDAFQNEKYAWLVSEDEIFKLDEDIFDYYEQEELDLKTDTDILKFMHTRIDAICMDVVAYHYVLYKNVYISASCVSHGQGGLFFSDFCIYKTEDEFWNFCRGSIISSDEGVQNSDAELISMFKKNVTDKYFNK